MTQRTLSLTQNNNLPNAVLQRVHSGLTNLDTKKQEKLTTILGKTTLGSKFYAASYYVTKSARAKHKSSEHPPPG